MKTKELGKLLSLNLVANSKTLQNYTIGSAELQSDDDKQTMFASLPDKELYSRLVSDVDFRKLSEAEKDEFLFLEPGKKTEVPKFELYEAAMAVMVQEAHNRTCKTLGIKPTDVTFNHFLQSGIGDSNYYSFYSKTSKKIYLDCDKSYTSQRPSFLLENINSMTYRYYVATTLSKLATEPSGLNDFDFFVAFSTALKTYVYEDLQVRDREAFKSLTEIDYTTPSIIAQELFGIEKTKADFKNVGLYNGKLQQGMQDYEKKYYTYLATDLGHASMSNMEDLLHYFNHSQLGESSGGFMFKVADSLVRATASGFYNAIGADMKKNQDITSYLDKLESEMFERNGVEPPTDEDLKEYLEYEAEKKEMEKLCGEEELKPGDDVEDDDFDASLAPFKNLFQKEEVVDKGPLPFHSEDTQGLDIQQ